MSTSAVMLSRLAALVGDTTCVCSSQLSYSSLDTWRWRTQLPRLIIPEPVAVIDSHSNEMYKNGCCSCPGLGAFCERLFTSSKTEVEKSATTTKLQPQIPPSSSVSEPEGEIYTALWPFQARADEELSFQEGEQFRICKREGDWWTAVKLDGNGSVTAKGVVPQNFLARRQTVKEQP